MSYILIKIPRHPAFSSSWSLSQSISFPHSQLPTSLPYWVSLEPTVCACVWGHPLQQGPLPAGTPPQTVWSSFPSSHQLATALLLGLGGSHAPLLSAVERWLLAVEWVHADKHSCREVTTPKAILCPEDPQQALSSLCTKTIYKRVTIFFIINFREKSYLILL